MCQIVLQTMQSGRGRTQHNGRLRTEAHSRGIRVHGSLWILDQLIAVQDRAVGASPVAGDSTELLGQGPAPHDRAVTVEAEQQPLHPVSVDVCSELMTPAIVRALSRLA